MPTRVLAATPAILDPTLAYLVQDAADPAAAAEEFRALFATGELKHEDCLLAVESEGDILGVIFAQRLGGAQADVWPPVANSEEIADTLAASLIAHLKTQGLRVFQSLVPSPAPPTMASLARQQFANVTDLIFLARAVTPADAALPQRLTLTPAAESDRSFAEWVEATYADSLDMPELNATRSVDELFASCGVAARGRPPLWWYAEWEGKRVGVLQLVAGDRGGEYELVYMGLVPSARGQGLGRELALAAISTVAELGGTRLELSRDARNHSAARIYDQLGFSETGRREVWLKISRDSMPLSKPFPKP